MELDCSSGTSSTLRGCMKVKTLSQSLNSCEEIDGDGCRLKRTYRSFPVGLSVLELNSGSTSSFDGTTEVFIKHPEYVIKKVEFDILTTREYETALCTNPCVKKGPAISIDWKYTEMDPLTIDEYETKRGKRKNLREMRLSRKEREERLRASGYTETEIKNAVNDNISAKNKCAKRKSRKNPLTSKRRVISESCVMTLKYASLRCGSLAKKLLAIQSFSTAQASSCWDRCNDRRHLTMHS